MSDTKKCENPACSCIPEKGQNFCSTHCEGTKGTTEIICECGHPSCKGDATRVLVRSNHPKGPMEAGPLFFVTRAHRELVK